MVGLTFQPQSERRSTCCELVNSKQILHTRGLINGNTESKSTRRKRSLSDDKDDNKSRLLWVVGRVIIIRLAYIAKFPKREVNEFSLKLCTG